ncbi:MAG: AAA family ATPase [Candidatus Kariarchaeaceae archaeon]|jgi:hypothetical protein
MYFFLIFGPPAVGKMAVGKELAKITGCKLFHNHLTIELLLNFFEFGSPKFNKLNSEFRFRLFEEIAESDLPGLIFTYVWALENKEDKQYADKIALIFSKQNADIFFVELEADLEVRLMRNKEPSRLLEKPSKRDTLESDKRLLQMEETYVMNTKADDFFYKENYLKINNTELEPHEVARKIINAFDLKN